MKFERIQTEKKRYLTYLVCVSAVVFLFLTAACGGGGGTKAVKVSPKKSGSPDYIFYPGLPNTPRYQYLTTFSSSSDIQKKKSKFFNFVAGDEQEKPRPIKKAYGVEMCDGVIYVCDLRSHAVVTLNLDTKEFGYIGVSGSAKLNRPVNLKIDKKNKIIYVADMGRKQVLSFSTDGRRLRFYGKRGQFDPSDVDIHDGKLFVCDVKGNQVHVLDVKTGETLYKIGKSGSDDGEFYHPSNIAVRNDRLYISDSTNFRVQIFDLQGNFKAKFGEIGELPGYFSRPKGIDVDREGRIHVVDAAFENVQVFDKEFKLLLYMFTPGNERHNINLPADVTIDYDNVSYFKKYLSPKFKAEYLLFVTSNFGRNKVNVYAYGTYRK
ncbi:MAG: 6-bladed beta-propeller [bacterium]|nr:6-bladed beta-propeller [bacterium]